MKKGDILFEVSNMRRPTWGSSTYQEMQRRLLASRRASLREGRLDVTSIAENEVGTLVKKLEIFRREIDENRVQQGIEMDRIIIAKEAVRRHVDLERKGYMSASTVSAKRDDVAARESQLAGLRRESLVLERARTDVEFEIRKRNISLKMELDADARQDMELVQDEVRRDSEERHAIVATADGVLAAVNVNEGEQVTDAPLARLIPDEGHIVVHLYADSRSIGFVERGQEVRVRFQAFPYQRYGQKGGVVTEVSGVPVLPSEIVGIGPASLEPLYRIKVKLEDSTIATRSGQRRINFGMAVEADIHLESRPLIQWLLEPIYGVGQRFS